MTSRYKELLTDVRLAFPSPVSNRVHDSYFVHSVMLAMAKADALKSERPILGKHTTLDYQQALTSRIADEGLNVEQVTDELIAYCQGLTIPGHPRTHHNVIPPASIPAVIGNILTSLYNPNLVWDEYSHRIALAEVEVMSILADLVGYNPERSGGLFTFGGTGATLYAMKVGLEKAVPEAISNGLREDVVIVGSEASHYCRYNIAGWLGLGTKNLLTTGIDVRNSMKISELRAKLTATLKDGIKIAGIIVTMGTTDAFGIDAIAEVVTMRDELVAEFKLPYKIHIHADAVIGWAWSVFNDYDFTSNPLEFRPGTIRMLAGAQRYLKALHLADSIGVDFHKSGFTPYTSSAVLFKNRDDLQLLSRSQEQMPYLYQFGNYRPGMYTLESSRSGSGVLAALANLKMFGKQGFQALIGHLVEMTQLMREYLGSLGTVAILNRDNVGPVTVFRVYPDSSGVLRLLEDEINDSSSRDELLSNNEYNRKIFGWLHDEAMAGRGGGVLSLTDCYQLSSYGEAILGLKSFIMSPFIEEDAVDLMVKKISEAQHSLRRSESVA